MSAAGGGEGSSAERPLRVLVVDDSALNRRVIAEILAEAPGVEVVGKAADGREALRLLSTERPDLITLDLEMPRLGGFSFLRLMMAQRPTPVIVVSSHSERQSIFRALELGALDFVAKPTEGGRGLSGIREELLRKVAQVRALRPKPLAGGARALGRTVTGMSPVVPPEDAERPQPDRRVPLHLGVVAASTGGPRALVRLFSRLPSTLPSAVLVVQHMPPRFTRTFARRLDRLGGLFVEEARDGMLLRAGRGYVAPGGSTTEVLPAGPELLLRVRPPNAAERYVPCADRAIQSAAEAAGARVRVAILSGMGEDGRLGAAAARAAGGRVFAESAETAVIFGMPKAAIDSGAVDEVLPLDALIERFVAELSAESLDRV